MAALQPLELPEGMPTPAWCVQAAQALDAATRAGPDALKTVLPGEVACKLFDRCQALLHAEPTLLEVGGSVPAAAASIAAGSAGLQAGPCRANA